MNNFIIVLLLFGLISCRNVESGRFRRAINQDDITLLVYTRAEPTGTEITLSDANNITEVSQFDTNLKTVFYVHGYLTTVNHYLITEVKESLFSSENVNFIVVNWDSCAVNALYSVSRSCVANVGTYVGEFVKTMSDTYNYSKPNITVVGHSLGAHIAGYMGKTNSGSLGIIVGIDPAGPLFNEATTSERLYDTDAQYVLSIHTDTTTFGVSYEIGHVNFWPNGGSYQTGCAIDSVCSHNIGINFFASSVSASVSTNNRFYARQCDTYSNFEDGDCSENSKALMTGINIDTSIAGNYYLHTDADYPYGQGDVV